MIKATEKTNTIFIWGLFLLTPILSLFISIKNFKSVWAKNIIWAFSGFYGLTFSLTADNSTSDINRYIRWFHEMRNSGMTFEQFRSQLYVNENYADVLQPFLTFFVSRFTDNHIWLIAVFGLVFGYFYSRNVWFVIERLEPHVDKRILFLVLIFALTVPIWNINGFRFWTATHIFFFGIIRVVMERRKIYIIPVLLTVFVHFSFTVPIVITLLYFLLGKHIKAYFYFFIISMFITEINITPVNNFVSSFLPEVFVARSEGYVADEGGEEAAKATAKIVENANWYALMYLRALNWCIIAFIIILYINRKSILENRPDLARIFSFLLYFFAVANVLSIIPSGGRFVRVSNLIAMAVIILMVQMAPQSKKISNIFRLSVPLLLLFFVISVRNSFNSMGLVTVAGNPVSALFVDSNVSLIELLK